MALDRPLTYEEQEAAGLVPTIPHRPMTLTRPLTYEEQQVVSQRYFHYLEDQIAAANADPAHQFQKYYSEDSFWKKLLNFACTAGREVVEHALSLYYAAQETDTPAWAKTIIYGVLGYFIFPVDAIPDLIPGVGYGDDLGALAAALATVASHVTPEIKNRAKEKAAEWFGV